MKRALPMPTAKISTVMISDSLTNVYCLAKHLRMNGIKCAVKEPAPHRYVVRVAPKDIGRALTLAKKSRCRR